jgi:hypothetical protein
VHRKYIPINIQQDATLHSLFISDNCSTCFGWKYHPKHVKQFADINKLCNIASCWIYDYTGILLGAHPILHISRIRVNGNRLLQLALLIKSHIALTNNCASSATGRCGFPKIRIADTDFSHIISNVLFYNPPPLTRLPRAERIKLLLASPPSQFRASTILLLVTEGI